MKKETTIFTNRKAGVKMQELWIEKLLTELSIEYMGNNADLIMVRPAGCFQNS